MFSSLPDSELWIICIFLKGHVGNEYVQNEMSSHLYDFEVIFLENIIYIETML